MSEVNLISVVIPLFNEQENVPILLSRIIHEIELLGNDFEIVCVDDGSSDNTFNVLAEIASKDTRVKAIKFRKNFGQTPAMVAGIDNSSGDLIVTMDGDLQNDPSDIGMLVNKIHDGYDIVVGWRHKRQDKLISRKIPSVIANWIIGKVTGVPIKDNGCSLKAYRSEIIKSTPLYSEMHRFIPAMASIAGSRIAQVRVKHHARQFGESKYGLSRIYRVILDLLTVKMIISFSQRPSKWFSLLSIPIFLFSFMMMFAAFFVFLSSNDLQLVYPGISILAFSVGVFLILIGALSEVALKVRYKSIKKFSSIIFSRESY